MLKMEAPGLADLTLAVRGPPLKGRGEGRGGRTCLVGCRTNPPLQVQRALYLDEALPDMAFVYLCNPTAGVLQGDSLQVRVRMGPGARAHLTTQAATKVFAMPDGSARVDTCLYLDQGAWLEYLPEPLIPFQGARYSQRTSVVVAPGSTLIHGEILAQGRAARGESLAYTQLQSFLEVTTPQGQTIFREAFSIAPGSRSPLGRGVLGASHPPVGTPTGRGDAWGPAVGTLLVVTEEAAAGLLLRQIRDALSGCQNAPNTHAGASALPGGRGVGIKVLAADTAAVRTVLHKVWAEARRSLLGVDAPPLRRY
ncbi:MAG TPA: urease accessory protein UreD [Dehalococcoidia bacterium]|nr:urease accessory protein UreD [Dehalococcoidia bacterium]